MKNLEKFNAETTPLGTELITRDGREVSEWYYFKTSVNNYPITAIVNGDIYMFMKNGQYYHDNEESQLDLFIKPKVREMWVNVFINKDGTLGVGSYYSSKENAIKGRVNGNTYIKTIRITDEPEPTNQ